MNRSGVRERSTLLGIAAILLWSGTVALARSIAERLGPLTAGAAVYLAAAGFLGLHVWWTERSFGRLARLSRRYVIGCGALFVLYTVALFLALGLAADRRQTVEVGLLNYLWPTLTILLALLLLGRRAGVALIPGTLLALCGVFLVLTQGESVTWSSVVRESAGEPRGVRAGGIRRAHLGAVFKPDPAVGWAGGPGRGAALHAGHRPGVLVRAPASSGGRGLERRGGGRGCPPRPGHRTGVRLLGRRHADRRCDAGGRVLVSDALLLHGGDLPVPRRSSQRDPVEGMRDSSSPARS